jgi:hypothetical protein
MEQETLTIEEYNYLRIERAIKDFQRRNQSGVPKTIKTLEDLKEKYKGNEALIKELAKRRKALSK